MTWLAHPELPDALIQVEDGSVWHYERSGWVETEAPTEPTTAELDAQLLAASQPEPEPPPEPEPEPEPPPDASADETDQPAESDE